MRPSGQQRERAVRRLRTAYVAEAISTDTFERRAAQAYRSDSITELGRLVSDLPSLLSSLRAAWTDLSAGSNTRTKAPAAESAFSVPLPARAGTMLIGRSARCDLVLTHTSVSREHLSISFDGSRWEARDVGSKNGSLLNGHHLNRALVLPGDHIQLGAVRIDTTNPRVW